MVGGFYWRFHFAFDIILASAIALFANHWLSDHLVLASLTLDETRETARNWLAIGLSTFALIAATIAFMFNVIDLPQFKILKGSVSRFQFWGIFLSSLWTLLTASAWCAVLSVMPLSLVASVWVNDISVTLSVLTGLELVKFTWVISQVVNVRASNS